jgi:hypothetical protein
MLYSWRHTRRVRNRAIDRPCRSEVTVLVVADRARVGVIYRSLVRRQMWMVGDRQSIHEAAPATMTDPTRVGVVVLWLQ